MKRNDAKLTETLPMRVKWVRWGVVHSLINTGMVTALLGLLGIMGVTDSPDEGSSVPLWLAVVVMAAVGAGYWAAVGFAAAHRVKQQVGEVERGLALLAGGKYNDPFLLDGEAEWIRLSEQMNSTAKKMAQQVRTLQRLAEQNAILAMQNKQTAIVEERRRIARELHDSVSQQLFSLQLLSASLAKLAGVEAAAMPETAARPSAPAGNGSSEQGAPADRPGELGIDAAQMPRGNRPSAPAAAPSKADKLIAQIVELSAKAQQEMRGLIYELRPPEMEQRGLIARLKEQFDAMCQQNGWEGRFETQTTGELHKGLEEHLYRIVQEALHNTAKHAQASEVGLYVERITNGIQIRIMDDGVGFSSREKNSKSYGLNTMRERAIEIGGKLDIFSKAGLGTEVIVRVPILQGMGDES